MVMKDRNGTQLMVGDTVAYSRGGRGHYFGIAEIDSFTPKMVRIKFPYKNYRGEFHTSIINPENCAVVLGGRDGS